MSRLLLLKGEPDRLRPPDTREGEEQGPGGTRIRCPRCGYEPGPHERWMCHCLHMWNTFETRGVCPGCGHQWLHTACPRCKAWSLHEDWYVKDRS
jgi:hypothetical protein